MCAGIRRVDTQLMTFCMLWKRFASFVRAIGSYAKFTLEQMNTPILVKKKNRICRWCLELANQTFATSPGPTSFCGVWYKPNSKSEHIANNFDNLELQFQHCSIEDGSRMTKALPSSSRQNPGGVCCSLRSTTIRCRGNDEAERMKRLPHPATTYSISSYRRQYPCC